ncbi:MAG: hypothetical protein K9J37_22580 [Saprospiraceae bacterium]|nr:hypothetical protein [Saprospiraceae bacterium]MCF8252711.1 hypothetical protein [Saprospiraceae bacterium]MCF8282935.1 hypothetical protein [Bacteroidales bacterium]MCF8311641.1 hypothetical protein [Saprospiraceae bacterium]MCF8440982.1 hypothetical protein [Saprospiraceae bacterium]
MKNLKTLYFLLPLFFVACAKPIALVVSYSHDTTATGTVKIVPSKPLTGTKLTVNDKLLVENDSQFVKSITVMHIPDGRYQYRMTCENSKFKSKLDASNQFEVKGEKEQTFLHETPPYSTGYWINQGLYQVGLWIPLAVLLAID